MAFEDNIYDGHTLEPPLAEIEDFLGRLPETALVDRGCAAIIMMKMIWKIRKSIIFVLIEIVKILTQ